MANNDFLPFGTAAGANVLTQADYLALAARASGFQSGVARSAQLNKVWRQSAFFAAVLGQLVADYALQDAPDDDNVAAMEAKLLTVISAIAGNFGRGVQAFTSAGASSWVVPTRVTSVEVTVIGGGGGGAGSTPASPNFLSGGGGGGGGGAIKRITGLTPGSSIAITIGAGGAGGLATNGNGANGGTTSFGAHCSATGGAGGAWGAPMSSAGGAGGMGAGGDLNIGGSWGGDGMNSVIVSPGNGGGAIFGGGTRATAGVAQPAAVTPGAGGGGNYGIAGPGRAAAPGAVIIRW